MARFAVVRSLCRICACGLLVAFTFVVAQAQVTKVSDDVSTPIEGVGHDYIHMLSETVNPANGSLSVRIQVPMPKGRGLTIPFSFDYDSNSVIHMSPVTDLPGYVEWLSNTGYLSQGGWRYGVPMASSSYDDFAYPTGQGDGSVPPNPIYLRCSTNFDYTFTDPSGGVHELGLGTQLSDGNVNQPCPLSFESVHQGGDAEVQGYLPAVFPDPTYSPGATVNGPLTVSTADGTLYTFGYGHAVIAPVTDLLPKSIEDRNGNKITVTDNDHGSFVFTDTAGRQVISSSGFGPSGAGNDLIFSGLRYTVTWLSTTAGISLNYGTDYIWAGNFPGATAEGPNGQSDTCNSGIPSVSAVPTTVVSSIRLPNGLQFQFHYGTDNTDVTFRNSFGLLNEIDYPNGAWVKYSWKLSDNYSELADYPGAALNSCGIYGGDPIQVCPSPVQDGCLYLYKTPVVASREVGIGGSPNPVLTQTFNYSTSWGPSGTYSGTFWTQKTTNVTTMDNAVGKSALTRYTYVPIVAPQPPFDTSLRQAGQLPVEQMVQYYDYNSSLLRTVAKTWYDPFNLASEQTTLENGQSSKTTYCYAGNNCVPNRFRFSQLAEKDEYDYGASAPTRKTLTGYQMFSGALGVIADRPCKTVVYDSGGRPAAETDYLYDGGSVICGASGAPSVSGAGGSNLTNHDAANFGVGSTIPRGNLTRKIQRLSSGSSPTTDYTYDETGQVTSMTDPNGNVTQYSYADNFLSTNTSSILTTAGSPPGGNVTNAYLTQVTHPATNGASHIETYTYGYNDGELTTATDQNQQTTTYRYDDLLGRLTERDYPDGGQVTLGYVDSPPNPTVLTFTKLNATTSMESKTILDGAGRVIQTELTSDPNGATTTDTIYTGLGQVLTRSNPHRASPSATDGSTGYVYDALGRTCVVIPPGGTTVSNCPTSPPAGDVFTSYVGNCTTVTDEAGKARKSCSDALGRLTGVWEDPSGLNFETDYQYDALDNLLSVTQKGGSSQANWRTRTFTYDSLSRLQSATNPESGTIFYSYDANGNVVSKTDARGVTTVMRYDALNRLLSKAYSDGTPPAVFYYDTPPAPWASNVHNTNGRLVEATTGVTPEP